MWNDLLVRLVESWLGGGLLVYSVAVFGQYLVLGALAFVEARRQNRWQRLADRLSLFEGDMAPPISILVPAFNEEPTIVDSVRSLMQLRYPTFELVVVNDGSRDRTLEALVEAFGLRPTRRVLRAHVPRGRVRGIYSSPHHPHLVVLDVVNGGKAQALNLALAFSRHPLFLAIDADSIMERDTLLQLALPFYEDSTVLVVGGVVRPANGCVVEKGRVVAAGVSRSHWARFQIVEYLRGMLLGRMGWEYFDSLYIVSGALGLFSREAVLAVGGYRTDTLGEDMELVMRIQRWAGEQGRRAVVRFIGSAVCWTEVPQSARQLARQRARWHQGLAESLWMNRALLSRHRFQLHHGLAFTSQFLVELLGPLFELFGVVLLLGLVLTRRADTPFALRYLMIFVIGGTVVSLMGLMIERVTCPRYRRARDYALLAAYALLDNFGYRQCTALWRVRGIWNALRRKGRWGEMRRRGHERAEAEPRASAPEERRRAA